MHPVLKKIHDRHGHYALIAAIAFFISSVTGRVSASKMEAKYHLDAMNVRFIASCLQILSYWCFGVCGAHNLGFQVNEIQASLLTSLSVVLGLASQSTLENVTSGLMLLYSRPFDVGDKIKTAGVTGKVVSVGFLQTRITTGGNAGYVIPNKSITGGTIENFMLDVDESAHQLRQQETPISLNVNADLEDGIEALERAAVAMDAFVKDLNADPAEKDFPLGRYSIAEHYKAKYGRVLLDDQDSHKASVKVCGQDTSSGHSLIVNVMCDSSLGGKVKERCYREAVKALKAKNVQLFDPSN